MERCLPKGVSAGWMSAWEVSARMRCMLSGVNRGRGGGYLGDVCIPACNEVDAPPCEQNE